MKKMVILFFFGVSVLPAFAEYRIWTDTQGHALEAELAGIHANKVQLRDRDGKVYKVLPASLSPEDREFLKGKIPDDVLNGSASDSVLDEEKPPRMQIKVTKKSDSDSVSWDQVRKDITVTVSITKKSMSPYSRKMKAKLYAIGLAKQDNYYVMLAKQDFDFDFNQSKEVELTSDSFTIQYYRSYKYGLEYEGFVVVVTDDKGKELTVEGSSNDLRDSHDKLEQFNRDDVFDKSFRKKGVRSGMGYYYR